MKVEQIYTGCLSQGAYYIESKGEVAIIDPLREVQSYINKAGQTAAQIKYIFETHFHADFVSGHLSLAQETGAPIIYGPLANPQFDALIATDMQVFPLGDISITAIHTPGHTIESTTYLLKDEQGKDYAIFSGDTLFLGDVGRPDLAQKSTDISQEELAGMLYESLRNKIMPLADDVIVYPGHGAGSACGKNMMKETVDTLGNQRVMNYALRSDMSKTEFVKEVTDGLAPPPAYFPLNVKMNREGYMSLEEILDRGCKGLSPGEFEAVANETGALVLDVRHQKDFVKGFVPQSVFIGLDGSFAPWVGALVANVEQPILLVVDEDRVEEGVTRLARVGFDHALGYLKGGIEAWEKEGKELDNIRSITADEFAFEWKRNVAPVFDVRKDSEYQACHLQKAVLTSLDNLNDHLSKFPKTQDFYLHCAGGYRSVIAASILKARGYHNLTDIAGGFTALRTTELTMEQLVPKA